VNILKSNGITQAELALALNVSQKTISVRLRKENWRINDAERIRAFLDYETIDELFFTRENTKMG